MAELTDPRRMRPAVDYSGLDAEPGSRGWILTRRSLMLRGLADIKNNIENCREILHQVEGHDGWQLLSDPRKRAFKSFNEFCESPNGFGMARSRIDDRLSEARLARPPLVELRRAWERASIRDRQAFLRECGSS